MMRRKFKTLYNNVLFCSISEFVSKVVSFLSIPIYSRYLSTADYAISDLITATVTLLIPICTVDIQDAVLRFTMDEKYDNKDVFSTAIKVILLGGLAVMCLFVLCLYSKIIKLNGIYLFFGIVTYFTMSLSAMLNLFCRGLEKVPIIAIGNMSNAIVTILLNLFFLIHLKRGLFGFLVSNLFGTLINITIVFFACKLWTYLKFEVPRVIAKEMMIYSLPLVFSSVAWWINNLSDRCILSWMKGLSVCGIYSISYKLPNIMSTVQNVFMQAWSISAVKEFDKYDTDCFIRDTYSFVNCIMLIICSILIILNNPISSLLFAAEFAGAWRYVPPLLVSTVFFAMSVFIGQLFTAARETKILACTTAIGALVNILLNFVLINLLDAYGAAVATLISYSTVFFMRHFILKKYLIMKIKFRRDLFAYLCIVVQMIFSSSDGIYYIAQVPIFLLIVLLYIDQVKVIYKKVIKLIGNKIIRST